MTGLAIATVIGLLCTAGLHVVWAFSAWPFSDRAEFSRSLLGRPIPVVPKGFALMSFGVAGLLVAAAYLVAASGGLVPGTGPAWVLRVGVWVVAAVLLARATVGGFVPSALRLTSAPASYVRLDLAVYSPICLILGSLAVLVAANGG